MLQIYRENRIREVEEVIKSKSKSASDSEVSFGNSDIE